MLPKRKKQWSWESRKEKEKASSVGFLRKFM
jgi:hypothetical protein